MKLPKAWQPFPRPRVLPPPCRASFHHAPASCSDLQQVNYRNLNGQAASFHEPLDPADLESRYDTGNPFLNQAGLGGCPPHVKAEHFRDVEEFAIVLTRN